MNPEISVVMISYKQESYIKEAIESILNQECSVSFELLISDDCSPDATVQVIENCIKEHPRGERIRFVQQKPNLGMMLNFAYVLQEAQGKFIAICEGDDYWTDTNKLQQQYDILQNDDSLVLSFHNAKIKVEETSETRDFNTYDRQIYNSTDLFDTWLIPTASSFFRNCIPKEMPAFLQAGTHGDLGLFLLLGEKGKFHYTDSFMSVYRINEQGVTQDFKGVGHNEKHIRQMLEMEAYFGEKHRSQLNERIALYYLSNAFHLAGNNPQKSREALRSAIKRLPSLRFRKFSMVARIFIKNILKK